MRTFFVQLSREIRSIFYTPVAYVVMTVLLFILGWMFQFAVAALNRQPTPFTILEAMANPLLFFFILSITTSLVTMRTFAEEFRMGTIEPLMTAPVKDWQIVLSKFFGTLVFYLICLAPSVWHLAIFSYHSPGVPPFRGPWAIGSTYLMLTMVVMLFISFGLFASSLVKDQVNAAIISIMAKIVFLITPKMLPLLLNATDPRFRYAIEFISPDVHMADFSAGIVDSRRIVWYLSLTLMFLVLTHSVFRSRKLKS